jgi:hypothetical protein
MARRRYRAAWPLSRKWAALIHHLVCRKWARIACAGALVQLESDELCQTL